MAAVTEAAVKDGDNGRGAMSVAVERDLSGTKRRHKENHSGNVGAAASTMAVTVEGDGDDSLSKNSGEITAKRDNSCEPLFQPLLNRKLTTCRRTGQKIRQAGGHQKRRRRSRSDGGGGEAEPGRQWRRRCGSGKGAEAVASRETAVATAAGQVLSWGRRTHEGNGGVMKTDGRRTGSGRRLAQAH